jgi:hypothetical protein
MCRTLFFFALCLTIALGTAPHAIGGTPATSPAAVLDPALVPFVTAGTLMVARTDLAAINAAAIHDWWVIAARTALDGEKAQSAVAWLDWLLPRAQRWLGDFHQAGGRLVYGVAFLGDPAAIPGVLIVPLGGDGNARAIAGLLVSGDAGGPDQRGDIGPLDDNNQRTGVEAVVMNNAVVYGSTPQVEKMKLARPVDRPMLAEAMASLGDAPVQIAGSPSIALQLIAGEALPDKLPDAAGGGDPADLVHTLAWAAWGGTPPPRASMQLLIQCTDALGAQEYAGVFDALLATMANDPAQRKLIPDMDQLVAALKPAVRGDLVAVDLNAHTLNDLVIPRLLLGWRGLAANLWSSSGAATQP